MATFTEDSRVDTEKLFLLKLHDCGKVSGVDTLDMVGKGRWNLGQERGLAGVKITYSSFWSFDRQGSSFTRLSTSGSLSWLSCKLQGGQDPIPQLREWALGSPRWIL